MSDHLKLRDRRQNVSRPTLELAKSERTRAAILDAALEYLWSRPFRDMTVNNLMSGTTVGRSAFYQYFQDLHELMETLLAELERDILGAAGAWFTGAGDARELLRDSLAGLVRVCFESGPILRAVSDAAPNDSRLERAWFSFLGRFDDAVAARIAADQRQGLIEELDARLVAVSLNRLDTFMLIHAFGRHPRPAPEPVLGALIQIWTSTLYGIKRNHSEEPLIRKADK